MRGKDSDSRNLRNIRARAFGVILVGLTLACVPRQQIEETKVIPPSPTASVLPPEVQAEIEKIKRNKAEARSKRPDCFILDVNKELAELAAGRDTYLPRAIKGSPEVESTIMQIRQIRRQILQQSATSILKTVPNTEDRALSLTGEYLKLAELDVELVRTVSGELREELLYTADCNLTKVTSLTADAAIEDLQRGNIRFPSPVAVPTYPTI